MAERVLRDHSQPCDHDAEWSWEGTAERRIYLCNVLACPGGREVTEAEIITEYLGRTNATGGNVDAPAV